MTGDRLARSIQLQTRIDHLRGTHSTDYLLTYLTVTCPDQIEALLDAADLWNTHIDTLTVTS